MSTSVEINAIGTKFEVNSNINIGDEDERSDRAGLDGKMVDHNSKDDGGGELKIECKNVKDEQRNHLNDGGHSNEVIGEESVAETSHVNGESSMEQNMKGGEINIVVNGEGGREETASGVVEVSPSSAGGEDSSAGGESPLNDNLNLKNTSDSPTGHVEGETDSIGSGKSPKKKGFLSGGLHIHMPKFSSRLSFGSDVSMTSTGSEGDGSPGKKKKKKDKKSKKKLQLDKTELREQENATPSEYSESVASERVDDEGAVSVTDTGLDQPEHQEEAMDDGTDATPQTIKDEGNNIQDGHTVEPVSTTPDPEYHAVDNETNKMDRGLGADQEQVPPLKENELNKQPENGSEDPVSTPTQTLETPDESSTAEPQSPSESSLPPPSDSSPPPPDDSETPVETVEESTIEEEAAEQMEQSTPSQGESSPREEGEAVEVIVEEEKKGATSSGEEGEEEDEGEAEEEKQKKKKKKKGIISVHFPHFGGRKAKSGEKSSDQSSDSDRALSPKRFGWKKRKDAKSPERKAEKEEEIPSEKKAEEEVVKPESTKQESGEQEAETQAGVAPSLDVDAKGEDTSVETPGASITIQALVPEVHIQTEGDLRPEEKLLAECEELVKEGEGGEAREGGGGGNKREEDFASTDALLEQIAETITSIEKAQNLRASQAMDVNVLAETGPAAAGTIGQPSDDGQQEAGLDLQADIPAKVDETSINLPSAQLTLAAPTESTLLEVSEEERSENQLDEETTAPADNVAGNDENDGESGAADVKETQRGEGGAVSSPEKNKSPRFKLHLPKFHLPKMHLSGKKDKKKPDGPPTEVEPSCDTSLVRSEPEQQSGNDSANKDEAVESHARDTSDVGVGVNISGVELPDVKVQRDDCSPEVSSAVDSPDDGGERCIKVELIGDVEAVAPAVEVDAVADISVAVPSLDANVNAGVPEIPLSSDVLEASSPAVAAEVALAMPSIDSGVNAEVPEAPTCGGLGSPTVDVDGSVVIQENQEVVVVMNEGTSEDDESLENKKEDSPEQPEVQIKSKKGRFKMPSLNFHMPKFGGTKKSYNVDKDVEAGAGSDVVGAKVNGLDALGEIEGGNIALEVEGDISIPTAEGLESKLDAEVNAGGGDISIEPQALDIDVPEGNLEVQEEWLKAEVTEPELPSKEVVITAVASAADNAMPSLEVHGDAPTLTVEEPSTSVACNIDASGKVEMPETNISLNSDLPCVDVPSSEVSSAQEVANFASIDVPGIESKVEVPSMSVTVDDPQPPAIDQDTSIKAKKKGLSLPAMHFRPKLTGKKWSRHPRFKSKGKENKLGASSKVATSLPDVAVATSSEMPLSEEVLKTRRASDIVDPRVATQIAAEQEVTAGGDLDVTPGKSKRSRFRFPNLHFSLPRFSSLLSPNKPQNVEEIEPEMTELKTEVDVMEVTAESDIPKTNLDVVMPEVSMGAELEGAVGGVEVETPDIKTSVPEVSQDMSISLKLDVEVPEVRLDTSDDAPKLEINAEAVFSDAKQDVELPDISTTDSAVNINEGEIAVTAPQSDLKAPDIDVPDVEAVVNVDADSPDVEVNGKIDFSENDITVESPDASVDVSTGAGPKKSRMKGLFPNMHLPKFSMKSPINFKSKGKKETVESPTVGGDVVGDHTANVTADTSANSTDLSMMVNTSADPHVSVDGGIVASSTNLDTKDAGIAEGGVDLPNMAIDADVGAEVKKSEIDVKSPSFDVDASVDGLSSANVDLPKVESGVQMDVGSAADGNVSGDIKLAVPDVSPDLQDGSDKADACLTIAGTVVIAYETASGPEVTAEKGVQELEKMEVRSDIRVPDVDVSSGATNQVLDLALGGGADVELKVDANIGDANIPSSDNEESDKKQKQKKKKKKRKGLHMPSISLPKFHIRQDKKAPEVDANAEANLPDVVVPNGQVDGSDVKVEASGPEITVPEVEIVAKAVADVECKSYVHLELARSAEVEEKLDPPSAVEAAGVVADVALELSPPEVEVPSIVTDPKEDRSVDVSGDLPNFAVVKDSVGASVQTPLAVDCSPNVETPSVEVDIVSPKVDCVVEAVIPSVCEAVTETLPDASANDDVPSNALEADEATSWSVPQGEVSIGSSNANVVTPDSSTSKPTKTKKGRMPKINLPKMNFKFSPHKSGTTDQTSISDSGVTNDSTLTSAEIEKIEQSLPSGEAQLTTLPTVEINGVGPEVAEAGETTNSTSKKGKYKKRIGGKLKKMKGKSKGKVAVTEDVKGEGLTAGISLQADGELLEEGSVNLETEVVDELENGLSRFADVSADVSVDNDSQLLNANNLITSTPIKSSVGVDGRLCKNNSAQAISEPTTPESMNLEAAVAIHSLPATPQAVSPIAEGRPYWVVVAIDFGTTFSGYAYSLTREPESVHIMRKWEGGDPGVTNMKTPTTLLLTPEGEFHSFGFTARDFYHDMDHKEAMRWLYFDKFKLTLHGDPDLNLKTEIKAANGQSFPAATVFEHSLRFFHDHAVEELCDQSTDGEVDPREIRWVLTVPAIWKQPAKQFMRHAAYKAGLASPSRPDQLLIALEPEAASIYIRKLRMRELAPEHQSQRQKWLRSSTGKVTKSNSQVSESIRHGTRYMVVDCGGGTVDITVHEVEEGLGTLKELHKAAGGMYGSVSIDQEFEQLLVDIFGIDFIEEFKIKRPAGWVDLMIAFEARKRNASPWKNNPLNVSLPFSFIDYYKKYTNGRLVEQAVGKYDNEHIRWSAQGMLRFTPEGMQRLFNTTIESLVTGVDQVLSAPSLTGISYLFLVGGFAQSALLQSAIRKKFSSQLRIVIPRDLGLSILKGAVLFGLDPSAVRVRRSRLTYGVGVLNKFQPGSHPDDKKVTKDNVDWCKDIFDTLVQADESVALGDKVTRSYTPAKPTQQAIIINIYCSDRENVRFITDEGVRKCGTLHIDVSDSQYSGLKGRRELQLTMQYGDTEIKVSALDVPTGKCVKSNIDFLNK